MIILQELLLVKMGACNARASVLFRKLEQTEAVAKQQISIQKDLRPSEFNWSLAEIVP